MRSIGPAAVLAFCLALAPPLAAQQPVAEASPLPTAATAAAESPPDATPAADRPSAAGEADFSAPVPVPSPSAKAMRYYRSGNVLWGSARLWGLLVPARAALHRLLGAPAHAGADAGPASGSSTVAIYSVLFAVVGFLLDLPLAYYSEFVRQHAYGLSNQTLGKWLGDALKGLRPRLPSSTHSSSGCPTCCCARARDALVALDRAARGPASSSLMLLVTPIWIDPLFNKFGPMKDKALEARDPRARRARGHRGQPRLRGRQERRHQGGQRLRDRLRRRPSASCSGTPSSPSSTHAELLFVMGHEMGHYVLGHVPKTLAFVSLLILADLWRHRTARAGRLIAPLSRALRLRRARRRRLGPLADPAASASVLVRDRAACAWPTRAGMEHESDRFGLEITRDNHAAGDRVRRLQEENLGNPRPGPALQALALVATRRSASASTSATATGRGQTGEPLRYGKLIRPAG